VNQNPRVEEGEVVDFLQPQAEHPVSTLPEAQVMDPRPELE